MNIYEWAKNNTLKNVSLWEVGRYREFMRTATRDEFLQSQTPFYHAVNAFPLMLLKMATKIDHSHQRLLLMENIWEEHGQGDPSKFHTSSFQSHLEALGMTKGTELLHNPFIDAWIENTLAIESIAEIGSYLAGIEYIYAVISESIAEHLTTYDLLCEQAHYKKHSVLDWEHGEELLKSVVGCEREIDKNSFHRAQVEFINLFDKMVVPTRVELDTISQLPVSFYHSREDSAVELEVLEGLKASRSQVNILSICSGGEHIINYLKQDGPLSITAIDANPHQLAACQDKLDRLSKGESFIEGEGKFEALFAMLRAYFVGPDNQLDFNVITEDHDKLAYAVSTVFTNRNLEAVFGKDATRYSSGNFAEHFIKAFQSSLDIRHPNAMNVLFGDVLMIEGAEQVLPHPVSYQQANLTQYQFDKGYDLIDLSNIGDWMPLSTYKEIIANAHKALNEGGKLILRKLMGDYDLKALLDGFSRVDEKQDNTHFYQQVMVAEK